MKRRPARDQRHACLAWYRADFLEADPNDGERLLCDACLEQEAAETARAIALQGKQLPRQKKSLEN